MYRALRMAIIGVAFSVVGPIPAYASTWVGTQTMSVGVSMLDDDSSNLGKAENLGDARRYEEDDGELSGSWWQFYSRVAASTAALLSSVAALLAVVWPARNYLITRQAELRWRRFEHSRMMWKEFTQNQDMQNITRMLEAKNHELHAIMNSDVGSMTDEEYKKKNQLDMYMDFLESLVYAERTGILKWEDLAIFGWYFDQFAGDERLKNYAREREYRSIVIFSEKFNKRRPITEALES